MVQWCWVTFSCLGVLLVWIIVEQGPTVLAVGAVGLFGHFFSLVYHFSLLSLSLWETARYKLKYCLKRPLSPKHPNPRWIVRSDVFVKGLLKRRKPKISFIPPPPTHSPPTLPPPPPPHTHPHNTLNTEQRAKQNRCFCRVL